MAKDEAHRETAKTPAAVSYELSKAFHRRRQERRGLLRDMAKAAANLGHYGAAVALEILALEETVKIDPLGHDAVPLIVEPHPASRSAMVTPTSRNGEFIEPVS
jgi:hypothetical protein